MRHSRDGIGDREMAAQPALNVLHQARREILSKIEGIKSLVTKIAGGTSRFENSRNVETTLTATGRK
jgi:hypothetical protein